MAKMKAETVCLELKDKVFTFDALRDKILFYEQQFQNNI